MTAWLGDRVRTPPTGKHAKAPGSSAVSSWWGARDTGQGANRGVRQQGLSARTDGVSAGGAGRRAVEESSEGAGDQQDAVNAALAERSVGEFPGGHREISRAVLANVVDDDASDALPGRLAGVGGPVGD